MAWAVWAGHPQGVALLGVNLRPSQATRQGWPYYIRPLHKPYDPFVYSRATPCAWPAARSHGLQFTPMRATPCAWPAARSHGLQFTPMRATPCGLTRGGFLEKFVVKSLERPTEMVALGTLLHRIPRPIRPKTSPCKPLAGGLPGARTGLS